MLLEILALQAAVQGSSGWALAEQRLEDGSQAIVLSRQQQRGRVEYRVRHRLRRSVAIEGGNCDSESSGTQTLVPAERLADARQRIEAAIGPDDCGLDADVLDGFDAMFNRLEERVAQTRFPDVQAWERPAAGFAIWRQEGYAVNINFAVADLNGRRTGEVEVGTYNLDCPGHTPFHRGRATTTGDLEARVAAAHAAVETQLRTALAQCSFPGLTVPDLMAGFDEALRAEEARLAAEPSGR